MGAGQPAKGMQRLDDAGPLGPAAASTTGQGDYSHGAICNGLEPEVAQLRWEAPRGVDDVARLDIADVAIGRQPVLG